MVGFFNFFEDFYRENILTHQKEKKRKLFKNVALDN